MSSLDNLDSYVMSHDEKVVYCDKLRSAIDSYMEKTHPSIEIDQNAGKFGNAEYQKKFVDGVVSRAFLLSFREPKNFNRSSFRRYVQNDIQAKLPKMRVLIRGEVGLDGFIYSIGLRRR